MIPDTQIIDSLIDDQFRIFDDILILDACCGPRSFYFDKNDPRVLFTDIRNETITVTDRSNGKADGTRQIQIRPSAQVDFRAMPFADETFSLVIFDPPHLLRAGDKSWLAAKYGKLDDTWQEDIKRGFAECFRVLKEYGTLVFKWSEVQIPLLDVLPLAAPQNAVLGHKNPKKVGTHWILFMKQSPKKPTPL